MMMNLFSSFDPCTGKFSLNWISMMILLIIMPMKYWFMSSKNFIKLNFLLKKLNVEIYTLMNHKGSSIMLISLFMTILINNMMGLLPYVFTSSSHLLFSLSMSLPLWLSFMIYGWLNKTNKMFIHLVPTGTPSVLMPFMVMIETISSLIRPGSLAVRLTANMIAGHILMCLLGNNTNSYMVMTSTMIIFIILMMFETAVSIIQAYVFMTLSTLYSGEI